MKKLVVKRPLQPVSAIPVNPPKRGEMNCKSPVEVFQEHEKSIAAEPTVRRPASGGVKRSLSEPSLQTVFVDYGSPLYFYILSRKRFREAEVCRLEGYPIIGYFLHK